MLDGFNNTWGIIRELGVPSAFLISTSSAFANTYIYIYIFLVVSSPSPSRDYQRAREFYQARLKDSLQPEEVERFSYT